ncbi:hypothetical protein ES706_03667 [subsurface metagenome]
MEGVAGATSKELRVSDGRETVSVPGNRERSERPDFIGKHRRIHIRRDKDVSKNRNLITDAGIGI